MQTESNFEKVSPQQLHYIVFAILGVFLMAIVSYLIAMKRVSESEKYQGFHLKSLDHHARSIPKKSL
jgi:hypothetical protein